MNGHEGLDQPLDLDQPWDSIVEAAREAALIEVAFIHSRPNLFATMEWIDHTDL